MAGLVDGQFAQWSPEQARQKALQQAAQRAGQMQGYMNKDVETRPEFDYAQQANDVGIQASTIMQESGINAGNNSIIKNINASVAEQQAAAQAALDAQAATLSDFGGSEAPQPHQMQTYMRALRQSNKEQAPTSDLASQGQSPAEQDRYGLGTEVLQNKQGGEKGGWDRQALGYDITPDEFLNSKKLQNQVARYQFGKYLKKTGSEEGALTKWHEKTDNPLSLQTFLSQILSQVQG